MIDKSKLTTQEALEIIHECIDNPDDGYGEDVIVASQFLHNNGIAYNLGKYLSAFVKLLIMSGYVYA